MVGQLAVSMIVISCLVFAGPAKAEPEVRPDSTYQKHPVPIEQELTFEKLVDLIRTKNIRRIEDVVAELPPEMINDNYVLMYRSRSLQEASPDAPRAIVFSPSARFVLTFNGGSERVQGANTLEMIQFREATNSFEFREMEFDGRTAPRISAANPIKCTECHQSPNRRDIDMRPNWEPYNIWPGAYGSNDGSLEDSFKESYRKDRFRPEDQSLVDEQEHEKEFFDHFFGKIKPAHNRYKHLGHFELPRTDAPLNLTDNLADLNFRRVARLMAKEREIFAPYMPTFVYRDGYRDSGCDDRMKANQYLAWSFRQAIPDYPINDYGTSANRFLSAVYESLGVDTSDWSMDFRTRGRFAFQDRFGTPSYPDRQYQAALETVVPATSELKKLDCNGLIAKLDQNLAPFFRRGTNEQLARRRQVEPVDPQAVLARCATCHTSANSGDIPQIDFLNMSGLKEELRKTGYPRGSLLEEILYRTSAFSAQREQMPPSGVMRVEETDALAKFLKEL